MPEFLMEENDHLRVYLIRGDAGAVSWHMGREVLPHLLQVVDLSHWANPKTLDELEAIGDDMRFAPLAGDENECWMSIDLAWHQPVASGGMACQWVSAENCELRGLTFGGTRLLHEWWLRGKDDAWVETHLRETYAALTGVS